tara:strand:- start:156 stop:374 length:219 start_codon:yes stop_codon:yes gene_type:complete
MTHAVEGLEIHKPRSHFERGSFVKVEILAKNGQMVQNSQPLSPVIRRREESGVQVQFHNYYRDNDGNYKDRP